MAKYLVVVESPAKAKTINKFLGSRYIVRASYGHVRDLPKSMLGVDIDNDFKPKYVQPRTASKAVKAIKEAAAKVDKILLATDPDREGEAIGWHIAEILKAKTKAKKKVDLAEKPIERIVFNAITKRHVVEAAKNPRVIDADLVNAQQARRVLDRLVGYKLSPLLQWRIRRGLSAGRVQSVTVRMVCDREDEIRAFIPVEFWTLDALMTTDDNESFSARLNRIRGEKAVVSSEAEMNTILSDLKGGASYKVANVERKEVRRRPSAPFITSSLQQDASRKLRFNPRRTMRIAQQLYEGISRGNEESGGLITYMRTDSTRIEPEALDDVRDYITKTFEAGMLPEKPNFYANKKSSQDAHEAIRPTSVGVTPESLKPYLDDNQLALYTLIWKRFVASQMTPAIFDQMTVDIKAADYGFRATGSIMKFPGFTKIYDESSDTNGNRRESERDRILPDVKTDDDLTASDLKPEQRFTKPPSRYTEAMLVRALEENGIGRPSTYAPTINTIQDRGYVEREKGRLKPTELGEQVNKLLLEHFPDIMDLAFTANVEEELDEVEEGKMEWHAFLREFWERFAKDLEAAQDKMLEELGAKGEPCPECGSPMEVREGYFGLFVACKRYPECKTTKKVQRGTVEETDEKCDKCGADMVIRSGRFGKFMACSKYPECKNTYNIGKDGEKIIPEPKEPPKKTDQKCPKCDAFLLIRKSRTGEEFYGCEKYPKCKFTKPMELDLKCPKMNCEGNLVRKMAKRRRFIGCEKYPECDFSAFGKLDMENACKKCGNPWTTVTKPRNKPHTRKCPVPDCEHVEELTEES